MRSKKRMRRSSAETSRRKSRYSAASSARAGRSSTLSPPRRVCRSSFRLLARGGHGQRVDPAYLIVAEHLGVGEEGADEVDRVGAPEHLVLDDEARHAEHAALRGELGRLLQRVLHLRGAELLGAHLEL